MTWRGAFFAFICPGFVWGILRAAQTANRAASNTLGGEKWHQKYLSGRMGDIYRVRMRARKSLALPYLTSPDHAPPYLTKPHLTRPHLTSPDLTSPYPASPHQTSPHHTIPYHPSPHHFSNLVILKRPKVGRKSANPTKRPAILQTSCKRESLMYSGTLTCN
jgi:hypothetical protein